MNGPCPYSHGLDQFKAELWRRTVLGSVSWHRFSSLESRLNAVNCPKQEVIKLPRIGLMPSKNIGCFVPLSDKPVWRSC